MAKRYNRWMIQVADPKPLKPRELARVQRHTLAAFNRAALYPVDQFELDRKHAREIFWLDCFVVAIFTVIGLCLVAVALGA